MFFFILIIECDDVLRIVGILDYFFYLIVKGFNLM